VSESNQDKHEKHPPKTDPRLKNFLRQAEAIIASQRGLNAASRLKLDALAEHLKLPKPLYDQAIKELQQSEAFANLTRYEKSYLKFLAKEFEKLTGGVLSPGMEKKALKHAETKYQINGTRAEQLIDAQAEIDGIARISSADSYLFAERMIVDQIGDCLVADETLQDELYQSAIKWGVEKDQVNQIIARQIRRNRDRNKSNQIAKLLPAFVLITVLVSVTIIGFRRGWFETASHSDPPVNIVPAVPKESPSEYPWLDTQTAADLYRITKDDTKLHRVFEKLRDGSVTQQKLGFKELVVLLVNRDSIDPALEDASVTSLLFHPNDEAVGSALNTLKEFLQPVSPINVKKFKDAYKANRLIETLRFDSDHPSPGELSRAKDRIALLNELVNSTLHVAPTVKGRKRYLEVSETEIATSQWNDLIQTAWQTPSLAAKLIQPLVELTTTRLPAESLCLFRDEAILTVLDSDQSFWEDLRRPSEASISDCSESNLHKWVGIYLNSKDEKLLQSIGPKLAKRLKIEPRTNRVVDVKSAIEIYDQQRRYRRLQSVIDRNLLLVSLTKDVIQKTDLGIESDLPDRIALVALAVNTQLAFCSTLENASQFDDHSFADFDRLISTPSPRLRELISLPNDRQTDTQKLAAPTASDKRSKDAAITRLSSLDQEDSGLRILALNQLERVAYRFQRLPYEQATTLANYLLSDLKSKELLAVEEKLSSFSHWPNLGLAIADQLPNSKTDRQSAVKIATRLFEHDFQLTSDDWRKELSFEIIKSVYDSSVKLVQRDPNNEKSNWRRLKIYLQQMFSDRVAIVSDNPFSRSSQSPADSLIRLHSILVSKLNLPDRISKIQKLVDKKLISNSINRTAVVSSLVAKAISQRQGDDSVRLVKKYDSAIQQTPDAGKQLLLAERLLLQIVDLKRAQLIDELTQREDQ
jgi:hypothetical protein